MNSCLSHKYILLKSEKRKIAMTLSNTPFLLLLLSIATSVSVVRGAVSISQCDGQPCVEEFVSSCADIAYEYDFSGECCVLTDSDDGSGGCTLTVYDGGCTQIGRYYPCGSPEGNPFEIACVGGSLVDYIVTNATSDGECPASDYDVVGRTHQNNGDIQPGLTMTLTGAGSLSSVNSFTRDEMLAEWQAITENHAVTFFEDNPDLGVFDVLTYINLNIASGEVSDELVLTYFQWFAWRSSPDDEVVNGTFIIEEAFTSEAGKAAYLASLQASDMFAGKVIAVSSVAVLTGPDDSTPLPMVPTLDTVAPTTAPAPGAPDTTMPIDPPSAAPGGDEDKTSAPGSDEESSALTHRLSSLLVPTFPLFLFLWQ
jgi:hypothetical protein